MIDRQKVLDLYDKNLSYSEIAKKMNISKSSVYYHLKDSLNDVKNVQVIDETKLSDDSGEKISIIEKSTMASWYRTPIDTKVWRDALSYKEQNHNSYYLYQIFREILLDTHVQGVLQLRKSKQLGMPYYLKLNGEKNEELQTLFDKYWFHKFIDLSMDYIPNGISVIELLSFNFDGSIKDLHEIPLKFIDSYDALFVKSPQSASVGLTGLDKNNLSNDFIDYNNDPLYSPYIIEVFKNRTDLGALADIAPLYIWKRSAQQAWATAAESFSTPIRIAKTSSGNAAHRNKLFKLVKDMGNSLSIVLDSTDDIQLIEQNKSDVSKIYDGLIQLCNFEISKRLLGGTLIMDSSGSFKQGEVHQTQFDTISREDSVFLEHIVNDKLIPKMSALGLLPNGNITFYYDKSEQLTLLEQFSIDSKFMEKFELDVNYLNQKYNTKILLNTDSTDSTDEIYQKTLLRNSPSGLQVTIQLLSGVKQGTIDRDSAIYILIYNYGYTEEQANNIIPKNIIINNV